MPGPQPAHLYRKTGPTAKPRLLALRQRIPEMIGKPLKDFFDPRLGLQPLANASA
ncbi:MAG: hypothetical protein IPM37_07590 [Hahellaceae bacterium]|nr:hypothetical protein [Hahellaceae bacterium]